MKKIFAIFLVLFLASGCDENTEMLSCNSTTTQNGIVTKTRYDVEYVNDEVKYVTITYDYSSTNDNDDVDGVNVDTDGLDEDDNNMGNNSRNADNVVDGVVGDAIDTTVDGVRETILDLAGIKNRYENQLTTYDGIQGFSYDVDVDSNTQYKIVYKIDMDKISDTDLAQFNVSRDFSGIQDSYEDMGYTCR